MNSDELKREVVRLLESKLKAIYPAAGRIIDGEPASIEGNVRDLWVYVNAANDVAIWVFAEGRTADRILESVSAIMEQAELFAESSGDNLICVRSEESQVELENAPEPEPEADNATTEKDPSTSGES